MLSLDPLEQTWCCLHLSAWTQTSAWKRAITNWTHAELELNSTNCGDEIGADTTVIDILVGGWLLSFEHRCDFSFQLWWPEKELLEDLCYWSNLHVKRNSFQMKISLLNVITQNVLKFPEFPSSSIFQHSSSQPPCCLLPFKAGTHSHILLAFCGCLILSAPISKQAWPAVSDYFWTSEARHSNKKTTAQYKPIFTYLLHQHAGIRPCILIFLPFLSLPILESHTL